MSANSVHRLHSEEEVHGYTALSGANGYHASDAPQPEAGHNVSAELCWQKFYEHPGFKYEWHNGLLEEKPVTNMQNAAIYRWLLKLGAFIDTLFCRNSKRLRHALNG